MNKLMHKTVLRFTALINIALLACPFVYIWFLYYADRIQSPYYMRGNWLVIALFVILYVTFSYTYDAFLISYNKISEMVYNQGLALAISDAIMYIVISLLSAKLVNIGPVTFAFFSQILLSILWSVATKKWYFTTYKPKRTAVIYDIRHGMEKLINEYGLNKKFEIVVTAPVTECIEGKMQMLKNVEIVFVCGVHSHDRNLILKYCIANDIRLFVIPRVGDVVMSSAKKMHMFHLPMLMLERYNPSVEYLFIKRIFDIVCSGLALIVASPFMLITAIAIKICDGGPVLYKQCRMTKNGRLFNVLKFRSMRVDAEKNGAQLSTGDKDDRVTPVGRFIRKVRIDELPQLINILRGDMSVVGPRPERPEIAEQYMEELPEFHLRLQAKAGLTGYAQVYGKYNTTPYNKLLMDLMYISNPSFVEDMKIVLATIKILFLPESTEGIAEGQTTAMGCANLGENVGVINVTEARAEFATAEEEDNAMDQNKIQEKHKLKTGVLHQFLFFLGSMSLLFAMYFLCIGMISNEKFLSEEIIQDTNTISNIEYVAYNEDKMEISGWIVKANARKQKTRVLLQNMLDEEKILLKSYQVERDDIASRYSNDGNGGYCGFKCEVDSKKLKENVCYEILLCLDYQMEDGRHSILVSGKQYIYNGKLYNYNPMQTVLPQIYDEPMKKIIEEGKLCFYDADNGYWVYQYEDCLYWIMSEQFPFDEKEDIYLYFHLYPFGEKFINLDFWFKENEIEMLDQREYRVATVKLPDSVVYAWTEPYDSVQEKRLGAEYFQIKH